MQEAMSMRLWYPQEKRMVYGGALTFDLKDGSWLWEGRHGSFHSHFGKLMYGTGVKIIHEKKEKELFAGDVIMVGASAAERGKHKLNHNIVQIVWDKQKAGFTTEPRISYADWGWDETVCDHTDRIKYLGNIYENPELLDELM